MKPIVTFDFDHTLSRKDVQEYVAEIMEKGVDVYVLTSRYDELHKHKYPQNPNNHDLYLITTLLGIPRFKIRFTCMRDKSEYLKGTNVLLHLDDDSLELKRIQKETNTKAIQVNSSNWKQKCNKIIFKK